VRAERAGSVQVGERRGERVHGKGQVGDEQGASRARRVRADRHARPTADAEGVTCVGVYLDFLPRGRDGRHVRRQQTKPILQM